MTQAAASSITTSALPARSEPTVCRVTHGFIPAIFHPDRAAEYLRLERFPRKAKRTAAEALAYATRALWYRERRAADKRRRLEAITHPWWFAQAAE
jgi:hypothetical protein